MSNVNVYFLGEEFSIPEELREHVGYLRYFAKIYDEVFALLTQQMQKKEYSGGVEADFAYFKEPLTKCGERIIADLANKNVFDVTLNDLVYNNKGYIQLHTVCSETIKGMANILADSIKTWASGQSKAYSSAASSITGSGVSVWTSSLSTAMLYSAFESKTLREQAFMADVQYRNEMKSLNSNIDDQQKKRETELLVNKYYPGVAEALGNFVSEMMLCYVTKLEQHGVFDYSKVSNYDMQRSSDLLKNISLVSNKAELLREAFSYCPHNTSIYTLVLENGLADVPTFETAKYLMQDDILLGSLWKYARKSVSNIDSASVFVKILALYENKDEQSIWRELYSDDYLRFSMFYGRMNDAIQHKGALVLWIKDKITSDAVELCSMSEESISEKVKTILEEDVITDAQFSVFKKLNLIDFDLLIPNADYLWQLNNEYAKAVTNAIISFIPEVRANVDKYDAKAKAIQKNIEEIKQTHESKNNELMRLKQQRALLGPFAFSKKKDLDAKISECQSEAERIKKSDDIKKLHQKYNLALEDMHSLNIT